MSEKNDPYLLCREIGEAECCRLIHEHAQRHGWVSFWRLQQHLFQGRSIRDIASESGVSSTAIYTSCFQASRIINRKHKIELRAKAERHARQLKWLAKNMELIEMAHVRIHNFYWMDRP